MRSFIMLTKDQVYTIIKRSSHIHKMIKHNVKKKTLLGNRKELFEINDDVLAVLSIEDEVLRAEKETWIKNVFSSIKAGEKNIAVISANPLARTKYYYVEKEFINRVYGCRIFKGLVPYEDILKGSPL